MANLFDVYSASFVTGVPLGPDHGWVVMAMDDLAEQEIAHSAILRLAGRDFEAIALRMFRTRRALWLPGRREVVFVGDTGECTAIGADGVDRDEFVTTSARNPRNTGHVRSAAGFADEVIAVGMQWQAYRRDAMGQWHDMMQGLPQKGGEGPGGFECVLALAPDEIYAAGWRGEIWLYDGAAWNSIDSPTNRIITAMCAVPGGGVLACGRNGMLVEGRQDRWQIVHDGECPDDLWALDASMDHVFAAGLRHLFEIAPDGVKQSDLNGVDARTFGALVSNAGVLWSMGEKDFVRFDGSAWFPIR